MAFDALLDFIRAFLLRSKTLLNQPVEATKLPSGTPRALEISRAFALKNCHDSPNVFSGNFSSFRSIKSTSLFSISASLELVMAPPELAAGAGAAASAEGAGAILARVNRCSNLVAFVRFFLVRPSETPFFTVFFTLLSLPCPCLRRNL